MYFTVKFTVVSKSSHATQGSLESLVDWRLSCRPPLVLSNLLPVAGRYAIWQRAWAGAGGPLKMVGGGAVGAGQGAHIYCADMRQVRDARREG